MRLWKWQILVVPYNRTVKVFDRQLDRIDREKLEKMFSGDYHVHRNPSRKKMSEREKLELEV